MSSIRVQAQIHFYCLFILPHYVLREAGNMQAKRVHIFAPSSAGKRNWVMIAWLCVQNTPTSGSHASQLLRSYYCNSLTIKTSSNTIRLKQRLSLSVKPCLKLVFSTRKMVACGFKLCVVGRTCLPKHSQSKTKVKLRGEPARKLYVWTLKKVNITFTVVFSLSSSYF